MCLRINELTNAMRAYSTRFDASLLSRADAAIVVKEAAAIEHMAAAVKSLAAARAAEAQTWKTGGYRSAEEQLAQTTGSTVAGAREALTLGRRLSSQPEVAAGHKTAACLPPRPPPLLTPSRSTPMLLAHSLTPRRRVDRWLN